MTADFSGFGEVFENLRENLGAMGGEEPPGGRKTPVWFKYVDVKAGDRINDIIQTGFEMHAAVTGKLLTVKSHIFTKTEEEAMLSKEKIDDIVGDLVSRIPIIISESTSVQDTKFLLLDDTFIKIFNGYNSLSHQDYFNIEVMSFNDDMLRYIEQVINYQKG